MFHFRWKNSPRRGIGAAVALRGIFRVGGKFADPHKIAIQDPLEVLTPGAILYPQILIPAQIDHRANDARCGAERGNSDPNGDAIFRKQCHNRNHSVDDDCRKRQRLEAPLLLRAFFFIPLHLVKETVFDIVLGRPILHAR